jgi:hypothetical protein
MDEVNASTKRSYQSPSLIPVAQVAYAAVLGNPGVPHVLCLVQLATEKSAKASGLPYANQDIHLRSI